MPEYYLPCPRCGGKIEVDTDYDTSVECESCEHEFDWRWVGRGSLALRQDGRDPEFYYNGVGRFREWEDDDDEDEDEDDDDDWDEDDDDEDDDEWEDDD